MPFGARKNYAQINAADWAALEEAGCVFLPSSRSRNFGESGASVPMIDEGNIGLQAFYWSATAQNASQANNIRFYVNTGSFAAGNYNNRYMGFSVRLVQDL